MEYLQIFSYISLLLLYFNVCRAEDFKVNVTIGYNVATTIIVDQSGKGNFNTIQSAIDSIPSQNSQWTRIQISPGIYIEKVTIPIDKPYIYLEGADRKLTSIEWNDHADTADSVTFTSFSDNIVAKGITFKNTYNHPVSPDVVGVVQAVAARILGDKTAFYKCAFLGVQDTLWDDQGRHYFHKCYIEGAIDFIFGNGQSIYEKCVINYSIGEYGPESYGYITAHGRDSDDDPSGYVFKNCKFTGNGKAYLGRSWRPFARVIIADSVLLEVVEPQGWADMTYVEYNCMGPGADTSKRVPWEKKLSEVELSQFTKISFIDNEGWIANLPVLVMY
ncbi:putative pectinesterase 55 [Fagus crenata]